MSGNLPGIYQNKHTKKFAISARRLLITIFCHKTKKKYSNLIDIVSAHYKVYKKVFFYRNFSGFFLERHCQGLFNKEPVHISKLNASENKETLSKKNNYKTKVTCADLLNFVCD